MDFNYMTGIRQDTAKTTQAQGREQSTSADAGDFLDKFLEKSGVREPVPGTGTVPKAGILQETGWITEADRASMSMTEYKLYLYDKIASLPVHPWNMQDFVAVHISEEGFEVMKNDPEYEAWVLQCLRANFQAYDPWGARNGGKFVVFYFGASKEECRVETWRPPCRNEEQERAFRKKAKDCFWERRRKRRKALLALYEELVEKKALSKRMAVSEYYAELAALPPEAEMLPYAECDARAMQIYSRFKANIRLRMFHIKNL